MHACAVRQHAAVAGARPDPKTRLLIDPCPTVQLSMSGSVPGPFGHLVADTAVGALLGLGAVCAVGYGGLLIAHTLRKRSTVLVRLPCRDVPR